MDIVPETINSIRLPDDNPKLLDRVLKKVGIKTSDDNENEFYKYPCWKDRGRLKPKEQDTK